MSRAAVAIALLVVVARPALAGPPLTLGDIEPDGEREVFGTVAPPVPARTSGRATAQPPPRGHGPPPAEAPAERRASDPDESVALHEEDGLRVTASSTLCEQHGGLCHSAARLLDGNPNTAWCEGVEGPGVGQTIDVRLPTKRRVTQIGFIPGYAKSGATWFNNARPRTVELRIDDFSHRVDIPEEKMSFAPGVDPPYPITVLDFTIDGATPPELDRFRLVIRAAWPGAKYADLCVSELSVFVRP